MKNQNSNGQYQNSRTHPSPGTISIKLNVLLTNNFLFLFSLKKFLHTARKFRRGRRQIHEWAGVDVNDFKSEEFDFQGNLDLFDKEKVFAEIRVRKLSYVLNTIFEQKIHQII